VALPRVLKDWLFAVGVAVVVFSVVRHFTGGQPDLEGQAPELALVDLDGRSLELSALRGQTVVLNFWASWCGPCRTEVPELSRFAHAHPDIVVLGLAVDSGTAEEVRASAESLGMDYRVALADAATTRAYDVSVLPTTVVVGPDGEVRRTRVGGLDFEDLVAAVR
jgi:cytochrome c biogenesis protein CcmG, thiol:disulfide interchange protein DsbE